MAVALSRTRSEQLQLQRKCSEHDDDIDTKQKKNVANNMVHQKRALVPVVYYLSRNGQLEHPHFMEVPLSSPQGLFLRDVLLRFNLLRGHSMAFHYSWSSKRSYKNGFVWHDLEENDFIHPVHGGEYVLKGSEILETVSSLYKSPETSSSTNGKNIIVPVGSNCDFSTRNRRRNQSWGAIDLHEYKVYKTDSTHEFAAADASTQTDDKRRRKKVVIMEEPEIEPQEKTDKQQQRQQSTELSRGEISPPPSDSSPETLESLMKADGRLIINTNNNNSSTTQAVDEVVGVDQTAEYCQNGRMKASSVLMSLISCGSISFRDCGATAVKEHGLSLMSHYKPRLTRGWNQGVIKNDNFEIMTDNNVSSSFAKMRLEDKEYFSGSLIETNKSNYKEDNTFISLKRSSSYNADRSSHLKLEGKEVEGVRAKCIPRRQKAQTINKKECVSHNSSVHNTTQDGT
ncbi:hypothetical protein RND81_04G168000 [Saponaria officinalis]|uniref:SOSEKI DIX-like domain-containing protein n=1 Tax=Saponaria officinalis TaxID=3572 RepID=A0AAW1LLT2_SAPOF